jgi:hypothetical protein
LTKIEIYKKTIIMKTLKLLSLCATLPVIYSLTGCGYLQETNYSAHRWLLEETGSYHHARKASENEKLAYTSNRASDYIFKNNIAIAVPAKLEYDLYISPYYPTKYFRCKEKSGTVVLCPYTGRPLILGKRGVVEEREIP